MKVGRFLHECLPVLPALSKLDGDEQLVVALGEAETGLRMEALLRCRGQGLNGCGKQEQEPGGDMRHAPEPTSLDSHDPPSNKSTLLSYPVDRL